MEFQSGMEILQGQRKGVYYRKKERITLRVRKHKLSDMFKHVGKMRFKKSAPQNDYF